MCRPLQKDKCSNSINFKILDLCAEINIKTSFFYNFDDFGFKHKIAINSGIFP